MSKFLQRFRSLARPSCFQRHVEMACRVGLILAWAPHLLAESQATLDPRTLAARIDGQLAAKWQGIEPAPAADDAEFLRRVTLDLAGRIPRVQEVRAFLDDSAPDRRARVVEQLLASPQYVGHFSATWRDLFLPPNNNQQLPGFKIWLEEQVRANTPYDKMVRALLTVPLPQAATADGVPIDATRQGASPGGFFLANEGKPENLAASTARIFMGVKLECAQCHDHPFARWSRAQFWEMAAFFPAPPPQQEDPPNQADPITPLPPRQIRIPGTNKMVAARFLTGNEPPWAPGVEPRAILADWLIAADNPYFAKAAVNRLWAHFFGVGLIDPVDDEPTDENPVSHPELLAELSRQFVAGGYDVKYLIRAITLTQAYQRTSTQTHASQAPPRAFARMAVRGLTPEQLFDSIALAIGFRDNVNAARSDFLIRFASQERATEKQTSILHALALMNGAFVGDAASLDRSATLAAVADVPFMSRAEKVETLYLAALGRRPRLEETRRLVAYVNAGGPRADARLALGDVFWALLNSSEFALNH